MGAETGQTRVWRPDWPCPVASVLGQQRHGGGDPTYRVDERGPIWRGTRTPEGPATIVVEARPADGEVHAEAWGAVPPGPSTHCPPCSAPTTAGTASSRDTRCSPTPDAAIRTPASAAADC